MKKSPIIKTQRGRVRSIQPQVLLWRKRRKRFSLLKKKLLKLFQDRGYNAEQISAWLRTPHAALEGKPPRSLLNPTRMAFLVRFVRKHAAAL